MITASSAYQWNYDLAIGMCFVMVVHVQLFSQDPVVVNLAIDCQRYRALVVDQWLRAGVCEACKLMPLRSESGAVVTDADNAETLMDKNWLACQMCSRLQAHSTTYLYDPRPHSRLL